VSKGQENQPKSGARNRASLELLRKAMSALMVMH
jgi:hypothetical protein